jgi:hypothetical protein
MVSEEILKVKKVTEGEHMPIDGNSLHVPSAQGELNQL